MDHIPLPHRSTHDHLEIPYLCTEDYDNGPFLTYPERKGWNRQGFQGKPRGPDNRFSIENSSGGTRFASAEEVASFVQAWLFFGLLKAVLGPRVQSKDFITYNGSGKAILTTKCIERYTREQEVHESKLSRWARRRHRRNVERCLSEAHQVGRCCVAYFIVDPLLSLSFAVLGEYLSMAHSFIYNTQTLFLLVRTWTAEVGKRNVVLEKARDDGWCPSDIKVLEGFLSNTVSYYASYLDRPGGLSSHERCTDQQCLAYQSQDADQYITKHFDPSCECESVFASQDNLCTMLRQEMIPVIRIPQRSSDVKAVQLDIVPRDPTIKYVAISHVWLNGLGNPRSNSLPRCQYNQLCEYLLDMYDSPMTTIYLWIDTLCCPADPGEGKDLALSLLRKTYQEADRVLVLDPYMYNHARANMPNHEALMRGLLSGWMRRLWTLQEGALAKEIYYRFADGAVSIKTLAQLVEEEETAFQYLYADFSPPALDQSRSDQPYMSWQGIFRQMSRRSTTVASDEPLCIGNLRGIEPKQIIRAKPERRMSALWASIPHVPKEFIFWEGPRLNEEGYRWAPASLLGCVKFYGAGEETPSGTITPSGIRVSFPGIILDSWTGTPVKRYYLGHPDADEWQQHIELKAIPVQGNVDEPATVIKSLEFGTLAFILGKRLEILTTGEDFSLDVVVVCIQRIEKGVIYARIQCNGAMYSTDLVPPFEPDEKGSRISSWLMDRGRGLLSACCGKTVDKHRCVEVMEVGSEMEERLIDAELTPDNQMWCLE